MKKFQVSDHFSVGHVVSGYWGGQIEDEDVWRRPGEMKATCAGSTAHSSCVHIHMCNHEACAHSWMCVHTGWASTRPHSHSRSNLPYSPKADTFHTWVHTHTCSNTCVLLMHPHSWNVIWYTNSILWMALIWFPPLLIPSAERTSAFSSS